MPVVFATSHGGRGLLSATFALESRVMSRADVLLSTTRSDSETSPSEHHEAATATRTQLVVIRSPPPAPRAIIAFLAEKR